MYGRVQDVSLGALLVASKLEDTLKKLKDIQIAAHQVKIDLDMSSMPQEPDLHARFLLLHQAVVPPCTC